MAGDGRYGLVDSAGTNPVSLYACWVNPFRRLAGELNTTWRILVKELSAFGVVGFVNLFVDIGLFNALHFGLDLGPTTSKVISTGVATTSAYFMNRHWSFSHRARTGLAREYSLFFGLNGIALLMGLVVNDVTYYVLSQTDQLSMNIANLIGIGLGTIFRFWAYKRWVFLAPDTAAEIAPDEAPATSKAH
jgi:putative flippase GtrA